MNDSKLDVTKVKSVWFKARMKGSGIVNYDGIHARWNLKKVFPNFRDALSGENVKMAKHSIRQVSMDAIGNPIFEARLKISQASLRHAIFESDQPYHNPAIIFAPRALVRLIASVAGLLRGYMFEQEGCVGVKRKSPVLISDAIQVNNTLPTFDIGTQLAPKEKKEDINEPSGTTMHYKECVGEVIYEFVGAIDLNLLQFISLSQMYDRLAVNPDYLDLYCECLKETLGSEVGAKSWYLPKTASNGLPEEGLLLAQDQQLLLVKAFFERLLSVTIIRGGGGYAKLDNLQVKHICNPLVDLPAEDCGYYQVKNIDDLKLAAKDIEIFYRQVTEKGAEQIYDEINRGSAGQKAKRKQRREIKADTKDKVENKS